MFRHQGPGKLAATVGCAMVLSGLINAPAAAADDRTVVPMSAVFRRCDFTSDTYYPARGDGGALARIGSAGRQTVIAQVELHTALPNTHYTARLIQTPRTSLSCSPTDPGVVATSLDTDAVGAGTVTLRAPALPGATGVWVYIDRPGEFSQTPQEFYTSDFIAAV